MKALPIVTVAVMAGSLLIAGHETANASAPPWGNTLEGRVSHLESQLQDQNADIAYLTNRIIRLENRRTSDYPVPPIASGAPAPPVPATPKARRRMGPPISYFGG